MNHAAQITSPDLLARMAAALRDCEDLCNRGSRTEAYSLADISLSGLTLTEIDLADGAALSAELSRRLDGV